MGKTVRVSVSIPAELKQQMDAIGESVDWSAVASRAFRAEVANVSVQRHAETMKDTLARLKASKGKTGSAEFAAGREAGVKWARTSAAAPGLERLADYRDMSSNRAWHSGFDDLPHNSPACMLLMSIIFDEAHRYGRVDRELAQEFWGSLPGIETAYPNGDICRGFVEGALSVWDEATRDSRQTAPLG